MLGGRKASRPGSLASPPRLPTSYTSPASPRGLLSPASPRGLLSPEPAGGCSCCWGACTFCTCGIGIGILSSPTGLVKLAEVALGLISHLLLQYYSKEKEARELGIGLSLSLSTSASGLVTSALLLICYALSADTFRRVRPSLFEVLFNALLCGVYITASTFLATNVYLELLYYYHTIPGFSLYPALTAAYVLGYCAGGVHGIDCLLALKAMRSTRAAL